MIVSSCQLRGLVGVVGVLRDLDGLDGGVRVGGFLFVLGRLLDDRIRLGTVGCVVGVFGGLGGLDGRMRVGVVVGVRHRE